MPDVFAAIYKILTSQDKREYSDNNVPESTSTLNRNLSGSFVFQDSQRRSMKLSPESQWLIALTEPQLNSIRKGDLFEIVYS